VPRVSAANHQRYAQARRDVILNAALRIFAQTSFAEAKMDEIAAAAELSKGTLYLYFPTKEALLQSLIRRYSLLPELPEMVESMREVPPELGIPTLVAEIWRRFRARKDLASVIVREIHSNPHRAKLFTAQVGLRAYRSLADYLDTWMKRGVLRRQDPLAAAQCLFGMLWFFLLSQELMGGKDLHPLSDETVATTAARMFLCGALAPRIPSDRKPVSSAANRPPRRRS
jgi:AcrR family transcriptional regulator